MLKQPLKGGATWDDYKRAFKKTEFSKVITILGKYVKMTAPQKKLCTTNHYQAPMLKQPLKGI